MIKLRTILLCDKFYIILCVIAVIFSLLMMNYYPYHSQYNIKDKYVVGYIHSYKIDGNKLTIMLKGRESIIVNYYFKSLEEKESLDFKLGDYIKASGEMNVPKSATIFNLFDYKEYLYRNQIFFLLDAKNLELVSENKYLRYTIKQFVIEHMNSIPKSNTYVKALVIGDDEGLDEEVNKSYQLNGVSHLFAISGSHITFLAVIILWILKKSKMEENKRYYIVIIFLVFYMFLTDYTGSVVRAVVFFSLLAINKMYYFNIKTINILQLTLFISLLYKPFLLYDVGFQFSYVISLYLILYQDMIDSSHSYIKQTFLISFIAFLVSIPICLNNFFQINLLSPIINLFFVPYVTFILFPLSFICLILPFLDELLFFFINILETISIFLGNIKIGEIILAKPSFVIILIYYIIITLCMRGISRFQYKYFFILLLMIIIHNNVNYFNCNPYIVFLDVGQGDSIFINLPHNKGNILIDTGGKMEYINEPWEERKHKYKLGEDTIIPYLKSIGVKRLDYLILTHGDNDHMGESLDIVKQFKVQKVLLNGGSLVALEKSLIKELKNLGISYSFGKEGDQIKINNYSFDIINPSSDTNENDNSLVLYLKLLNTKVLLTGDISTKIEEKLINEYSNLKVDILKLGHHGSITSTSEYFLDFLKPEYAIIQVGLKNKFNHPSDIVMKRLSKRSIKTFQTSIKGSIKIIIRANAITVKHFKT